MENNDKAKNRILAKKKGTVISDKADKTIVVAVDMFKTHPKYKKKFKMTRHYKVHDENNKYKIGDIVEIQPARPMSRDKKYKIV
jgi:small subunit ribosomal protein S17